MYLSQREKIILEQLLYSDTEVLLVSLESLLKVSRRTVYRELTNLEKSLKPLGIQVLNEYGRGYRLIGDTESINLLKQENNARNEHVFTISERQSGIVTALLIENKPMPADQLSKQFDVSLNTIYQDINAIEESFDQFELNRIQAKGFAIVTSELNNRSIVSANIFNQVSEEAFFTYIYKLYDQEEASEEPYFLSFLSDKSLKLAITSFIEFKLMVYENINSSHVALVLIQLAYSIDRLLADHQLNQLVSVEEKLTQEALTLSHQVMNFISDQLRLNIPINERNLLANQLAGINFNNSPSIFNFDYDTQLSYQVQVLIRHISEKTGNDFRKDDQLYDGLLSHIKAALKRNENNPSISFKNANLEPLVDQYKVLYKQIMETYQEIFSTNLSHDEAAYLLMHFVASYERNPSLSYRPKILIIVTNYVGTGKIIKAKLEKQFQDIFQVDIIQFSKLDQMNYGDYSLVLSTSVIKDFPVTYHLISPTLNQNDSELLAQFLKKYKNEQHYQLTNQFSQESYQLTFQEMYSSINLAHAILNQFEISDFEAGDNVEDTIWGIIQTLPEEVISDDSVAETIITKYHATPIGIPNTNMALFHSIDTNIHQPLFKIYNLSDKITVEGMDGNPIKLQRILLLLAPSPLDPIVQNVLSWISHSIVDNNINTDLYNHGNEDILKNLLSRIFVEGIQEPSKGDL